MIKLNWILILAIIVLLVLLYLNNKEHFGGSASSSSSTSSTTLNYEAVQNLSSLYNTNDLSASNLRAQNTLKVGNNTIMKDVTSINNSKGLSFNDSNDREIAGLVTSEENGMPYSTLAVRGDVMGSMFRISDFPADSYIRHERGENRLNGLSISTINKGELRVGGPDYEDNKYRQFKRTKMGKQILQWSDKGIDVTGDINLTGKISQNLPIGENGESVQTTKNGISFINYENKNGSLQDTSSQTWIIDGQINTTLDECRNYLGKLYNNRVCTSYVHDGNTNKCWVGSTPFFQFSENTTKFNSGNIL